MVQGQHAVGFAAAEVGLQFDNRISPLAAKTLHGIDEQLLQALGDEGAAGELRGVLVFGRCLA